MALASDAIDETRRDLVRSLSGPERKVVKGTRLLLLKGLEALKPGSLERMMLLMEANEPLYQAYLLKEDLRQFWSLPDANAGSAFLDDWTAEARATGIAHFARWTGPGSPCQVVEPDRASRVEGWVASGLAVEARLYLTVRGRRPAGCRP